MQEHRFGTSHHVARPEAKLTVFVQSLLGALVLVIIHLLASQFRFLDVIPRSRWLSIAGGVSVAYALVHLLPELQAYHNVLAESPLGRIVAQEHLVWFMTLLGLLVFYGMEKLASRRQQASSQTEEGTTTGVFWIHIASYSFYNALIGYLLVREDRGLVTLVMFVIGIGLHFLVNDHALRQYHADKYRRIGRWILSAAILVGWSVGIATEIHEVITASILAFLAGGIILNTFKEELPRERESNYWSFAGGALVYAAILLAV